MKIQRNGCRKLPRSPNLFGVDDGVARAARVPILTRSRSNGKDLLGRINSVLDIAKIASGQSTLNMAEYTIERVVEAGALCHPVARQNKMRLVKTEISLPVGLRNGLAPAGRPTLSCVP